MDYSNFFDPTVDLFCFCIDPRKINHYSFLEDKYYPFLRTFRKRSNGLGHACIVRMEESGMRPVLPFAHDVRITKEAPWEATELYTGCEEGKRFDYEAACGGEMLMTGVKIGCRASACSFFNDALDYIVKAREMPLRHSVTNDGRLPEKSHRIAKSRIKAKLL